MSIRAIHAIFECDGCGCQFGAEIDTAGARPLRWSMVDIANDALRSGSGWITAGPNSRTLGQVSYQKGRHLCPSCTLDEDGKHTVDCDDDECEGICKRKDEASARQEAGGCWVRPDIAAKLDLRRRSESAKEYALRKGIR